MQVALSLVKKYNISTERLHLDSSSFHVHGEYNNRSASADESEEPRCIEITYGYSRDHRPDLKQFTLDLMCSGDGDIPLWMKVGSGNSSDTQQFARILQEFKKQIDWESLFVTDSAFYSRENLHLSANLKWLTRVPLTLKAAQEKVSEVHPEELIASETEGYSYHVFPSNYGGIEQRWLLVESEKRRESDLKKLEKNVEKARQKLEKELRQLSRQSWACIPDARRAAQKLFKKAKYHQLGALEIEEIGNSQESVAYRVTATASEDCEKLAPQQRAAGRFVIATNVLDSTALSHTVPNQLGRPTQRPTLRWIFQCFQAIHVLDWGKGMQVSNLNEERLWMLKFFPPACQRYYLVA